MSVVKSSTPFRIFVLKGRLGVEGLSAASSTPSKVLGTANRILDGLLSGVIVNIYVARADLEGAGRGLVKPYRRILSI